MTFEGKHSELTEKIIGAFYEVYNHLGFGFSEKVYENAMIIELTRLGMEVKGQIPIKVFYKDSLIGEFFADLLINEAVLIELKAVSQIIEDHEAQLLNYLKSTPIEVGLLLNFGPKAQYKRKVFDNIRKGSLSWINKESET
jgi:GxxExxY protein